MISYFKFAQEEIKLLTGKKCPEKVRVVEDVINDCFVFVNIFKNKNECEIVIFDSSSLEQKGLINFKINLATQKDFTKIESEINRIINEFFKS